MLATERLLLRRPTLDDAADPHMLRFVDAEAVDMPAVVRRWLDDWETYPLGKFIVQRKDGVAVGRVGLNYFDPQTWERSASPGALPELGWTLAREHWGRGYATEAALAVRALVTGERLISLIAPDNVRSQNVARRLGATPGETVTAPDGSDWAVWEHPR